MVTTVVYIILVLVILFVGMHHIHKLYPEDPIKKGEKVNIYQDGIYNRTATVTGLSRDRLVIYDALPLPVHYRGKFYSIGYTSDGVTLLFLGRKRLYFLARMAELIRKIVHTPEYLDNTPDEDEEAETKSGEEVEDEL